MQLRYMNATEAAKVMEEIHESVYGLHMNEVVLAKKLMKQGFF